MQKTAHKILFPGWGVPKEEYTGFNVDTIVDYGFFSEDANIDLLNPDAWLAEMQTSEPYILIAHSMGSLFVLRNSQLRDNAQAIVIISGFAKFAQSEDNPDGKPVIEAAMMQKQLRRNPQLLLKSFHRTMFSPEKRSPISGIKIPAMCNISQLHHGLELLKICDIRKDIGGIKTPVMILHGEKDGIVSAKLAETLHQKIPHSQLKLFPEAGHGLPLTHTYELLSLIEK